MRTGRPLEFSNCVNKVQQHSINLDSTLAFDRDPDQCHTRVHARVLIPDSNSELGALV